MMSTRKGEGGSNEQTSGKKSADSLLFFGVRNVNILRTLYEHAPFPQAVAAATAVSSWFNGKVKTMRI